MELLKRHLFLIICGVVAAGSIALGALAISAMSEVQDKMQEAARLASDLQRGTGQPVNQGFIKAEEERIAAIRRHHEEVLEWARQRNTLEPLVPGLFPKPDRDRVIDLVRDFKNAYQQRLRELLQMLDPGTPASAQDVSEMAETIREEELAAKVFEDLDRAELGGAEPGPEPEEEEEPRRFPSGLLTDYGAKKSAAARANIAKAHQFRCYATPFSLEEIPGVLDPEIVTPSEQAMWNAQVSLWIQETVIPALARVNDEAAARIREQGQTPWVGNMPVKELISIRTPPYNVPYIVEDAPSDPPALPSGWTAATPPASPNQVFTHSASNQLYDVVQFTLKLVVDARMIPRIVDEICQDNFHTLLRLAYNDLSPERNNWSMENKIYGADPTVMVVMDFETIFLTDVYRPLMPNAVREQLGLPLLEDE